MNDRTTIEAATTKSATGRPGEPLAGDQQRDRGEAEGEDREIGIGKLCPEGPQALEEVIAAAGDPEEFR